MWAPINLHLSVGIFFGKFQCLSEKNASSCATTVLSFIDKPLLSPPMKRSELEEIMRLVDLSVCVSVCLSCLSVCVHDCTNSASSNALTSLPCSEAAFFCLPFPCVYITSLGGDMHSYERLLVKPPATIVREGLTFYCSLFFFFIARSPRSVGRSPRNFATSSECSNVACSIYKCRSKNLRSAPKKFGGKNTLNLARFRTLFHFELEHLRNGQRYPKKEN